MAVAYPDTPEWLNIVLEDPRKALQPAFRIKATPAWFRVIIFPIAAVELGVLDIKQIPGFEGCHNLTFFKRNLQPIAGFFIHDRIQKHRRKKIAPDIYSAGLVAIGVNRKIAFPFQIKNQINKAI
jgi:hypothetical protein